MEFKKSIIVDQPIEAVWEVLGHKFGQACEWASGIYHSESFGSASLPGAQQTNRACETSQGNIKEEVLVFDPEKHHVRYQVVEGFPFFVDTGVNDWKLSRQGSQTKVDMHLVITTKGLMGGLMGPIMNMQMGGIVNNVLDDFKHYVEHGEPSQRKQAEIRKRARKAA